MSNFIKSYELSRINKDLDMTRIIVKSEAPEASFCFQGVDTDDLVLKFKVVAKKGCITDDQIRNLKEKTPFEIVSEQLPSTHNPLYIGQFKLAVQL